MTVFILTLAGLCFSGFLSFYKLVTKSCAFGETCPYFLGYPACWYGFFMYLAMFIITILYLRNIIGEKNLFVINAWISVLGIGFSGNFVANDIIDGNIFGALGLNTCTYGFIFFVLICISCVAALRQLHHVRTHSETNSV